MERLLCKALEVANKYFDEEKLSDEYILEVIGYER